MVEEENSGKSSTGGSPFHPALVRKLVQSASATGSRTTTARDEDSNNTNNAPKRMTPEAMLLAGELLRLFVLEARQRAAIEAECEREGSTELAGSGLVERQAGENEEGSLDGATSIMVIQPHHITKVAAELLMDFS